MVAFSGVPERWWNFAKPTPMPGRPPDRRSEERSFSSQIVLFRLAHGVGARPLLPTRHIGSVELVKLLDCPFRFFLAAQFGVGAAQQEVALLHPWLKPERGI